VAGHVGNKVSGFHRRGTANNGCMCMEGCVQNDLFRNTTSILCSSTQYVTVMLVQTVRFAAEHVDYLWLYLDGLQQPCIVCCFWLTRVLFCRRLYWEKGVRVCMVKCRR